MKETPYELLKDVEKKQLGKNEEAKMTISNALPRKEYERVFMCKIAKERSKVTVIEEAKDLATLPLDELIGNLKVYEMVLNNDGVASKTTKERVKSLALKAKVTMKQTSDNSICQGESDEDEEINLVAKNFRKLSRKGVKVHDKFDIYQVKGNGGESLRCERKCYNCGSRNHLASNCPKPNNKAFVRITWNDSEDDDEPQNNATFPVDLNEPETQHNIGDPSTIVTEEAKKVLTDELDSEGAYGMFQPYRLSDHSLAITAKLKALKKPMRKLLQSQGNLHARVNSLRSDLDEVQKALDINPYDMVLREAEAAKLQAFMEAKLVEERFLKQKAKIDCRIEVILDANNVEITVRIFVKKISDETKNNMVREVSNEEIKSAMFNIGDDRTPGPDGFSLVFFKKSWNIVGEDVCSAIKDFFHNGKLLKEINHTFLSLIPKVTNPTKVMDYRPISCCNVLYKCISKILSNRIIDALKEVISHNQSAFVLGRRISNNILMTQELMHNYHRKSGPPRCAFKVDIQKAYDTVNWGFLENILFCFGFYTFMIKWILACVTSASYSICINGEVHGYFNGMCGLRQSDPLSPYLFTLVMEILTLIIKRRIRRSNVFHYHHHCDELEIVNLCFADDLFLFAKGEVNLARLIMDALEEFQNVSGLVPSIPKSTVYFCNVRNSVKNAILNIMSFNEGMDTICPNLSDIVMHLTPIAHRRTTDSIFGKLILAASAYFIWVERNNRLFRSSSKNVDDVCDMIKVTISCAVWKHYRVDFDMH
uniref:Reverse transcriptase domain-containing protein n=1 Tax=Tanacetum cinerariifolium TaxID=118510 RepID=A0A6L2NCV5_TANCI|nr:hypothetical protein [Tanacetum cinerariifolium]